jgi:hypothetical protein
MLSHLLSKSFRAHSKGLLSSWAVTVAVTDLPTLQRMSATLHRQGLKGSQSLHNLRTFHLGEVPLHLKKKNARKPNAQLSTEESTSVALQDEKEVIQDDTLGQLLRKIAKQAPQDVKGRYFLSNLLAQVETCVCVCGVDCCVNMIDICAHN